MLVRTVRTITIINDRSEDRVRTLIEAKALTSEDGVRTE